AEGDDTGTPLAIGQQRYTPPVPGAAIHLTLDQTIQQMAEDELGRTVARTQAHGGSILIMDSHTGGILAMASWPGFDPNTYRQVANSGQSRLFTNPATSDTYEPGSTMKIVTVAAALDQGVVTPRTTVPDAGVQRIEGTLIHNWDE